MSKDLASHYTMIAEALKGRYKMKFAAVAPIHIYESLANRRYHPDNILLLAHDVVKPDNIERYESLFHLGAWSDVKIIMDNSLIELKGAVDIGMIREAVNITGADVVVLPDSLTDGPESAKLTIDSWDEFKTVFDPMAVELMAVVQGETQQGFFTALDMIAKSINPDWISIPRRTESKFGYHRAELIPYVQMFFPDKPIHLLGFSDYPWEDIRAAGHKAVASIDSAAPLRSVAPFSDPGTPRIVDGIDWWDTCKFDSSMLKRIEFIDSMIHKASRI